MSVTISAVAERSGRRTGGGSSRRITTSKSTACAWPPGLAEALSGGRTELCAISVIRPVKTRRGNASISMLALSPSAR